MDLLVQLHSFWRWAVLLAAVVAFVGALAGWLGRIPAGLAARRDGAFYTIALDIQLLLGLAIWIGKGWYSTPGFYRFEHPGIMILAVIVAHAGTAIGKRAKDPAAAARTVALSTLLSLSLVVIGIPGVIRGV